MRPRTLVAFVAVSALVPALSLVAGCGGGNGAEVDAAGAGDGATGSDGGGTGPDAAACQPGFVDAGSGCVPIDPADPAQRTQAEVCARWASDHVITDPTPFSRSTTADCDAGTLSAGGHADTLTRINLFRWLAGLGPTTVNTALDAQQQQCANLESWWDFSSPQSPHSPPNTAKCYTASAASGAGMSNIAWGNGPAASIDQFVQDNGNATTMGHRRWIVNPPLSGVGIGYWEGGGMYGKAECLSVFGASGTGPNPAWVAVPNPGVVPVAMAGWTWTFHSTKAGTASATIAMTRVGDGAALPVMRMTLQQGFGQPAISWKPMGWTPVAGEAYRVTVSGLTGGDVTYVVKPVTCP